MKKNLSIFFVSILFFISLFLIFDKKIISSYIFSSLSKTIGKKVTADPVKIDYLDGLVILNNFEIINKNNFVFKNIFQADQIAININLKSIFSDLVLIKSLTIQNPEFFIEIKETINNTEKKNSILIEDNLGIVEKINNDKEQKIFPKKRKDKNFIIFNTNLKNFKTYLKYPNNKERYEIKLSDMFLKNIGNANTEQSNKYKSQHYKSILKLIYQDMYLRIPDQKLREYLKRHYKL